MTRSAALRWPPRRPGAPAQECRVPAPPGASSSLAWIGTPGIAQRDPQRARARTRRRCAAPVSAPYTPLTHNHTPRGLAMFTRRLRPLARCSRARRSRRRWPAAGYFQWDTVELPADSGAACGDGSPVPASSSNRTPLSKKHRHRLRRRRRVLGPAAPASASGRAVCRQPARHPARLHAAASTRWRPADSSAPFSSRNNPFQAGADAVGSNIVYLPYCTGDVHSGSNRVAVYADADPANPRVEYHRGQANVRRRGRSGCAATSASRRTCCSPASRPAAPARPSPTA